MKNRFIPFGLAFSLVIALLSSCTKEPVRPTFPLAAEIYYTVDDQQVAFTALTHSAVSWNWDFGDGTTSSEENPAHIYEEGGYYKVTLTATDASGNTKSDDITLALNLTPYAYLTGDYTAEGYDGKTWRLTQAHPAEDKLALADLALSYADPDITELPTSAFALALGMPEVYEDEFTFYYDGSYKHDVKEDGAAFSGLLYQYVVSGLTGSTIVNDGGADFGLCTGVYTPEDDATFVFVEKEDFAVPSVWGNGGVVTYPGVMTIDFPGSTEFIGIMDFQRKVIVQEITANTMRLVMFLALSEDAIGVNTHALVLTFEVVN